jgi:hypothetical protein
MTTAEELHLEEGLLDMCGECQDTLCEELYKDEGEYCCICYEVESELMCYECHTDYLSSQIDRAVDEYKDHLATRDLDN